MTEPVSSRFFGYYLLALTHVLFLFSSCQSSPLLRVDIFLTCARVFSVPALYQKYPDAVDEWGLSEAMRADTSSGGGISQMEDHYKTFIVGPHTPIVLLSADPYPRPNKTLPRSRLLA